jgi:signal transduction histidine kinase
MSARELRGRTPSQQVFGWRVATASRVFVLALATGQTFSARAFTDAGVLLAGLVILAAIACTLDIDSPPLLTRLIPVAEGALAAVLLGSSSAEVVTLLPYFIAPPLAAGIRAGWVTCLNSTLATLLALVGTWLTADAMGADLASIEAGLPWLAVGMAAGLLASWQTRSLRQLEDAQAPYLAAHRLMTQLHAVSQELSGGLDSATAGEALVRDIMTSGSAARVVLFTEGPDSTLNFLIGNDGALPTEDELAETVQARKLGGVTETRSGTAFPLHVGEHQVGIVLIAPREGIGSKELAQVVSPLLESHAVPLDTALLFDDVREVATAEERQRLARDIHDGVAQDIASLGYAIDELSASSADPQVKVAATELRNEVTRVVGELRHSIFDLRSETSLTTDLENVLAEYVTEAAKRSGLVAHVDNQVVGSALPSRTQAEILRITQEAVSNVRKHAGAENIWLRFATDGRQFALTIVDDGKGHNLPQPRAGHYGLHTMQERAARINASLVMTARPTGGTSVHVHSSGLPADHPLRGISS